MDLQAKLKGTFLLLERGRGVRRVSDHTVSVISVRDVHNLRLTSRAIRRQPPRSALTETYNRARQKEADDKAQKKETASNETEKERQKTKKKVSPARS